MIEPLKRSVVRKTNLRECGDSVCPGLTPLECLSILAELNRIGMAAVGLADAPMRRDLAIKRSGFVKTDVSPVQKSIVPMPSPLS